MPNRFQCQDQTLLGSTLRGWGMERIWSFFDLNGWNDSALPSGVHHSLFSFFLMNIQDHEAMSQVTWSNRLCSLVGDFDRKKLLEQQWPPPIATCSLHMAHAANDRIVQSHSSIVSPPRVS